tara:strand:+ start:4335 stop:5549 length:1215 start_codon:yes stop_codon:yes gene_type:complete
MNIQKFIPPLVLSLPFILGVLITGLGYPLIWDEAPYYSISMEFGDNYIPSIDELKSYNQFDSTPLSAIIFGVWGKIFGFDLWKLRVLSTIFGFGSILLFFVIAKSILKKYNSSVNPLHLSLILLLNPYFYVTSFLILSDSISIFFFMLSLFYFTKRNALLLGIFAGLAILTRQFYLFFPISIIIYLFFKKRSQLYSDSMFIGALLSLAMFLPLFYLWDWHLSPANPQAILGLPNVPSFSALNYHLAILAFYCIPLITQFRPRLSLKGIFYPLLLLPVFIIAPPLFNTPAHGILYFTIDAVLGPFKVIPLLALWYVGIIILFHLNKFRYHKWDKVFLISILIFSLMMPVYSWISDKYLLAILPLLLISLAIQLKQIDLRLILSGIISLVILTGLYAYLLFFKMIN